MSRDFNGVPIIQVHWNEIIENLKVLEDMEPDVDAQESL